MTICQFLAQETAIDFINPVAKCSPPAKQVFAGG